MRKVSSKIAFTLIELIISTVLVAVILLGLFSVNMVLNSNNQDYGQRYFVKSATQTTLNHILNNASLAVGSTNLNDEGILIGGPCSPGTGGTLGCGDPTGNPNTFCIHQAGTSTAGGQNVIGSVNDIWLCYQWYPSNTAYPNQIRWCAETYNTGAADPRGASSCSSSTTLLPAAATPPISTFLGTAYSISYNNNVLTLPTFTNGLFSITIQNCLNDALGTCNNTGTSIDLSNNPEVQISGSVLPSQVSNG